MKRIVAIDTLRGFAILGILLMNIISFAMPEIAYYNPAAFGGDAWIDQLAYGLTHIFADQKFMALFSMLFGASVMLLIDSLKRKGRKVARFHYVRNVWLLVFGFLHSILIWFGDILTIYALCAFVLFFLRNVAPKWQFTLGLIVFMLPVAGYIVGNAAVNEMAADDIAALDEEWFPTAASISAEIDYYRGDYIPQVTNRLSLEEVSSAPAVDLYYTILYSDFFARAFGMMLIGMALYSWGVLTGKASERVYRRMLLIGMPIGVVLAALGLWWNYSAEWEAVQAMFIGRIPNQLATPLIAGGYIALVMLWSRTDRFANLQQRLAATGRMALTNYIGQSIIGTFIFYGFGLGLFGSLSRSMLLPVVAAIWALQLWLSPIWLRHYRYGPLEWAWRSLSYWQLQPMRR